MSDELLNRARELLALREKATPIEGAVFNRYWHGGGRLYNERAGKRTLIADCFNESDREFFFAAYDMADTIRDLLAENERLQASLRELASAEPVAWAKFDGTEITHMEMSDGSGADFDLVGSGFVPLIRRPEVKS